jgi:hypothetical protein
VVPELGVTVGYQLTDAMRLYAGYNLLFWSGVARPGQQIDTIEDVRQMPVLIQKSINQTSTSRPVVPPRPAVRFQETGFWAQGLNCGFELRY